MKTKFIEATNIDAGGGNHGKFMVARFTEEEWQRRSDVEPGMLTFLQRRRWTPDNILVVDLETGEGAIFKPGGYAKADLEKHKIWVCPMAEKFLEWLYTQDLTDLDNLPGVVQIADPTTSLYGYRRPGSKTPV